MNIIKMVAMMVVFFVSSYCYANIFTMNFTNKTDKSITFNADTDASNPVCYPQGTQFTIAAGATAPISFMCQNLKGDNTYPTWTQGKGIISAGTNENLIVTFWSEFNVATHQNQQSITIENNSSYTVTNSAATMSYPSEQVISDVAFGGS